MLVKHTGWWRWFDSAAKPGQVDEMVGFVGEGVTRVLYHLDDYDPAGERLYRVTSSPATNPVVVVGEVLAALAPEERRPGSLVLVAEPVNVRLERSAEAEAADPPDEAEPKPAGGWRPRLKLRR